MQDDEILRPKQAAAMVKLSLPTLYEMAQKGEIPARRVGNQWRFSKRALQQFIENPTATKI